MPKITVQELLPKASDPNDPGGEQIAVQVEMDGRIYDLSAWVRLDGTHELTLSDRTPDPALPHSWRSERLATVTRKHKKPRDEFAVAALNQEDR